MFSLSSLVGSHTHAQAKGLEFTPIGQRVLGSEKKRNSPSTQQARARLSADKVNNSFVDSTFDNTARDFDTLSSAEVTRNADSERPGNAGISAGNSNSMFDGIFRRDRPLLSSGSNSIQELQDENKALSSENYNLKIEVATLTKFLKQTPQETRELAHENVALKQELLKVQNELDRIRLNNSAATPPDRSAVQHKEAQNKALRQSYKEMVEEHEHEISRLQRKLAEAERNASPAVPQDLLDKMEHLQNENQTLLRRLEQTSSAENDDLGATTTENNQLKTELYRLRSELSRLPSDAAEQLERLRNENESLQRKSRSLNQDLEQAEQERDALQSATKKLRAQIEENEAENIQLRRAKDELVATRSKHSTDKDTRLEQALDELESLRAANRRAERNYTSSLDDINADLQRSQHKINFLTAELEEKDREVLALREQVRSLVAERDSGFDNKSTIKNYQSQIDDLREKERNLTTENRGLKDDVARLQDELYSVNIDSSQSNRLRDDIKELNERLEFYEQEYGLAQEALEAAESEVDMLKAEQKRAIDNTHSLEAEIESLQTKLRRLELSGSYKYNESAVFELEEAHRKREETERRRTSSQVDALNQKIRKLEQELEDARRLSSTVPEQPRSSAQLHKMQRDLDDKEFELQEKQRVVSKLQASIRDKESVIEALEARVREVSYDYRTNFSAEDTSRKEIQRLKSDHEFQLKAHQLESDRIQRELEDEIKYYKTKMEVMMERESFSAVNSSNSPIVALLESELDESRRLNRELSEKLEKARVADVGYSERLAEETRIKLQDLQSTLDKVQAERNNLENTIDTMETDNKLLRAEKVRLEVRAKNLSQELARTSRHCTKLASKINELDLQEYKNSYRTADETVKSKRANAQLQAQVDSLNAKLAEASLNPSSSKLTTNPSTTRLLRNELQYCKAKLFEINMRCSDLALMNTFMVNSIKSSNRSIKNDLVKLAQCGIYPDYSRVKGDGNKQKLTFKTLATFVLSSIRLKKRSEKAKERKSKLALLRSDIERDKISLLAEN